MSYLHSATLKTINPHWIIKCKPILNRGALNFNPSEAYTTCIFLVVLLRTLEFKNLCKLKRPFLMFIKNFMQSILKKEKHFFKKLAVYLKFCHFERWCKGQNVDKTSGDVRICWDNIDLLKRKFFWITLFRRIARL